MPLLSLLGTALALVPCRIEHPSRAASWPAECGALLVPENPSQPNGRKITLQVARIAAISRRKQPDPLFLIAGGPGMATSSMYAGIAPAFARIARDRDIVLVDQRGTGKSNPLPCKSEDLDDASADRARMQQLTRECLATLSKNADVTQYTTSVAVRDLDAVRSALGYERINIYGVSYGTRVAQHYLRRYPTRVRSLILDGVIAPGQVVGPDIALDAEAALTAILQRCQANKSCVGKFGDPVVNYRSVRTQLQKAAVDVTLLDPALGTPRTLHFTSAHLAGVLRLQSYASQTAALLPLALHAAAVNHDYSALAGQYLMTVRNLDESLSYGMHNAVVCSEDVPQYPRLNIDRGKLDATYIGAWQLDALVDACAVWPRGPVDADFHEPLKSSTPVLLLSGANDPVTPPAYATAAARNYSRSRHVIVAGMGHGQVRQPCMDRVMEDFLRDTNPQTLDVQCTARLGAAPFFLSPNGPAP